MKKYCTKCGKEISQDDKFCVSCGTKIKDIDINSKHIKKSNNGVEKIVVIIMFIFVIGIVTIVNLPINNSPVTKNEEKKTSYLAEKYKDEIEKNNPISNVKDNIPTKVDKCSGQNNLTFLEKNYKLYDLNNHDNDIKFNSNEMKIYGIIKNNSFECPAKNIKIKVLLKKGENIMQEVNLRLKDVVIYSGKTSGYSEKFEVYESLLNIGRYDARQLRSDIKASIIISSVNEPISDLEKKYLRFIDMNSNGK